MRISFCFLLAALLVAAGCQSDVTGADCLSDDECGTGLVCMAGNCVEDGTGDTDVDAGGDTDPTDTGNDADPTDTGNDADPTDTGNDTDPTDIGNDTDPTDTGNDIGNDTGEDVEPDAPAVCGDGTLDPGEQCDDGDGNSNTEPDACREDCSSPRCFDNVLDTGEECETFTDLQPGISCSVECRLVVSDPCFRCNDTMCPGADNVCLGEPGAGGYCVTECQDDNDCPANWSCGGEFCQFNGDVTCAPECFDPDNDGYGDGDGCLGFDCNEESREVNPGAQEICFDGVDNDCDGDIDCADPQCAFSGACVPAESDCENRFDDDFDGQTDCADDDCFFFELCAEFEYSCDDEFDNDGNGLVDCDDPECDEIEDCFDTEICWDGEDNDGDGFVDCADFDCEFAPSCIEGICDDFEDNDNDGFIDCDDFDCIDAPWCGDFEFDCKDGYDNDGNGFVDCEDFDCEDTPECFTTNEICGDFWDNDGDFEADCDDEDCAELCEMEERCSNSVDDNGDGLVDCEDPSCDGLGGTACSSTICPGDMFEPNNFPPLATDLELGDPLQSAICSNMDIDWYYLELPTSADGIAPRVMVNLVYAQRQRGDGDTLSLELYAPDGTLLRSSTLGVGVDSLEVFGGFPYVLVRVRRPVASNGSTPYRISAAEIPDGCMTDDGFEENDVPADAVGLSNGRWSAYLCPGDPDRYTIGLDGGMVLGDVLIKVTPSSQCLSFAVFNDRGDVLHVQQSSEQMEWVSNITERIVNVLIAGCDETGFGEQTYEIEISRDTVGTVP